MESQETPRSIPSTMSQSLGTGSYTEALTGHPGKK